MVQIVFGVLLMLLALWGGSYLFTELKNTWMHTPATVTAFVAGSIGIVLVAIGIADGDY